jgi:galactokinase
VPRPRAPDAPLPQTPDDAVARVAAARAGVEGERWFSAPGRVNLVGDHTDYNAGFVLPLAVDRWCVVAAREADTVRVRSLDVGETVDVAADGGTKPGTVAHAFGRVVAAVVHELAVLGRPAVGMDAVLASDVPLGSGLSSSAALEVSCAVALGSMAAWEGDPRALAEACRSAEELATGVPCGIMDQLASVAGRADEALLIDCRSLEIRPVRLPESLGVLVVHSGLPRTLAGSAYAERRVACEALAHKLGLSALRDATEDTVADEPLGRHVVSENRRVLDVADALAEGDLARVGHLFAESHASLRDDFAVSTAELDLLVEELVAAGALGARLTGAGFGGCVVAACDAASLGAVAATATARYRARTGLEPTAFPCRAVDGAGPLESTSAPRS